jgi:3-hydroxyisobutyrate dehydrogenase
MMKFCIYGAGEMGGEIAKGMIARGCEVYVHDPFRSFSWPGKDLGIRDVSQKGDVHLVCVRGVLAAEELLFGHDGGLVGNAKPESMLFMMTTMSADDLRRMAERAVLEGGVRFVDAAMSRRRGNICDRSLTVLLGCSNEYRDVAIDVCSFFADNVLWVGDIGSGMNAKLINNWVLQMNRMSLIKAMEIGVSLELAPNVLVDVINSCSGSSWVSDQWGCTEEALMRKSGVDRVLAERTKDEVEMLISSLEDLKGSGVILNDSMIELLGRMEEL